MADYIERKTAIAAIAEYVEDIKSLAAILSTPKHCGSCFSAIGKKKRMIVYAKYDGHCAYCGEKIAYKLQEVEP